MFTLWLKYYLFSSLLLGILCLKAQSPDENNQAIITIIGDDPIQTNNTHDFINTNPYYQPVAPPEKERKIQQNLNIEPTLENGFHMRFEVSYSHPIDQSLAASYSSANDDNENKVRKRATTFNERKINAKKRLKKWLPVRKKRYRPYLCGRF